MPEGRGIVNIGTANAWLTPGRLQAGCKSDSMLV
jgi:hypothetical protein